MRSYLSCVSCRRRAGRLVAGEPGCNEAGVEGFRILCALVQPLVWHLCTSLAGALQGVVQNFATYMQWKHAACLCGIQKLPLLCCSAMA
jgi:hypothetical protein